MIWRAIKEWFSAGEPPAPMEWIDPTFVLLRQCRYDCAECGCPGWFCVTPEECLRSSAFTGYRVKLWVSEKDC